MNTRNRLPRMLDTWLQEEGVQVMPGYLDDVLARTSATGQRPAWRNPGRWLTVDLTLLRRLYPVPAAAWYLLLIVLLGAAVVGLVAFVGGQRRLPSQYGLAANGLIAVDAGGSIVTVDPGGTIRSVMTRAEEPRIEHLDASLEHSGATMSPDGTKVAYFVRDPTAGSNETLVVADIDGSGARAVSGDLTITADPTQNVSWAPSGHQLTFSGTLGGTEMIFVANADGSGVKPIGSLPFMNRSRPNWSPSGEWIVFKGSDLHSGTIGIYLIRPDGSGERRLPTSEGSGWAFGDIQFAPDLTNRIAYTFGPEGAGDIAAFDIDTNKETVLSTRPDDEFGVAWSPDAARIVFNQATPGAVVVNADGTGLRLLPDVHMRAQIYWSPDGTRIMGISSRSAEPGTTTLVIQDIDGPAPAVEVAINGETAGALGWQRLAP